MILIKLKKKLIEEEVTSTRKISCNALTYYYRIEWEIIYKSVRTLDGNFNYTNEQKSIIKIIKPIKDILTERTLVLHDKYEEERNKMNLLKTN